MTRKICCRVSREMFRGRPSESTTPFTRNVYSCTAKRRHLLGQVYLECTQREHKPKLKNAQENNCDIKKVLSGSSISRAILPHPKTQIQHHKWHHKICFPFRARQILSITERVVWQEKVPRKVHESAHDNFALVCQNEEERC